MVPHHFRSDPDVFSYRLLPDLYGVSSAVNTPSTQEATPPENDSGETSGNDGEAESDSDYVHEECREEQILIKVHYDHNWVWSPDGTTATGWLKGEAEGGCTFLLYPMEDGYYEPDTCTIFYSQHGKVKVPTDGDECTISGRGMAVMTLGGSCEEGHLVVDIMEIMTEELESTIICGPKKTDFVLYYPLTMLSILEIPPIGIGEFTSDSTIMPQFYDLNLYWWVTLQ